MSKAVKIFLITAFIIALILNFNFVFASSSNDIVSSEDENIEQDEENETNTTEDVPDTPISTLSPSSVTSVSNVNSYEQANLQLNNILSIILIAIGVLLILFAIAILIRLKK